MPNLFWGRIDIRDALPHGVPQARALLYLPPPPSPPSPPSGSPQTLPMLPSDTMATGSPVLFSSIHLGETFDSARDVNQGPWSPAVIPETPPTGVMQAETVPPIVITRQVPAVGLVQLQPSQCGDSSNPSGCWIADFGENMAGIVRVKIRGGSKGQRLTLRFGELVHDDGSLNVNTSNNAWKDLGACGSSTNRPGEQMDILFLSGQTEQEWAPSFVYHGFRCNLILQFPCMHSAALCEFHSSQICIVVASRSKSFINSNFHFFVQIRRAGFFSFTVSFSIGIGISVTGVAVAERRHGARSQQQHHSCRPLALL